MAQIIGGGLVGPTQGQYQQQADQAFSQNAANMFVNARNYAAQQRQQRFANGLTLIQQQLDAGRPLTRVIQDQSHIIKGMLRDGLNVSRRRAEVLYDSMQGSEASAQEVLNMFLTLGPESQGESADDEDAAEFAQAQTVGYTPPQQGFMQVSPAGQMSPNLATATPTAPPQTGPGNLPASAQGVPTDMVSPDSPLARANEAQRTGQVDPRSLGTRGAAYAAQGRAERGLPIAESTVDAVSSAAREPTEADIAEATNNQQRLNLPEFSPEVVQMFENKNVDWGAFPMPKLVERTDEGYIDAGNVRDLTDEQRQMLIDRGFTDADGNPDPVQYEMHRQWAIHRLNRGEDPSVPPSPEEIAALPFLQSAHQEWVASPQGQEALATTVAETTAPANLERFQADFTATLSQQLNPDAAQMLSTELAEGMNQYAREYMTAYNDEDDTPIGQREGVREAARDTVDAWTRVKNAADFDELSATSEGRQSIRDGLERAMNDAQWVQAYGMVYNQPESIAQASLLRQVEEANSPAGILALQKELVEAMSKAENDALKAQAAYLTAQANMVKANASMQDTALAPFRALAPIYEELDPDLQTQFQVNISEYLGIDPSDVTVEFLNLLGLPTIGNRETGRSRIRIGTGTDTDGTSEEATDYLSNYNE